MKDRASDSQGLAFTRHFGPIENDPFDDVDWQERDVVIKGEDGKPVFEQRGVLAPSEWSPSAVNIAASKYFRGKLDTPEREDSIRQLIRRVVNTIVIWGREGQYFRSEGDLDAFKGDLKHLLVNQMAAFNSPVWFNIGAPGVPQQASACFINSVDDSMESIMDLAKTEAMLFKGGSGTGTNLSSLRSSHESLEGGGTASGPVSFMKGYDAFAGVIKSGGRTRRAAKMVILNHDHPDIMEFINCKVDEEKKAHALIDAGFDGSFTGPVYGNIFFQNANNSVRVTDKFMRDVENDNTFPTYSVTEPDAVVGSLSARKVLRAIAESTHACGDPGMQFDTTINDWHTCPQSGPINASNPCSEYVFLDDTACNLASINLMKFRDHEGVFDSTKFSHAVRIMITAMEILVDNADYPTERIARNSYDFRPLGLGYANLGALLMSQGFPYDSDKGRRLAAGITALMTGEAYAQSARISRDCGGPFRGYKHNSNSFERVIRKHRNALHDLISDGGYPDNLAEGSRVFKDAVHAWDQAVGIGFSNGFRNAQATVLAPTGTIGLMMDCDTTGIEPDLSLVKVKRLVGGGMMEIVNQTVGDGLLELGYSAKAAEAICMYVKANGTVEGAPGLGLEHLPVFDCANPAKPGGRSIHHSGHIKMVAAAQPFISGAISKTINMPNDASVEQIEEAYIDAWHRGVKAVAIYRDGSKRSQPLSTMADKKAAKSEAPPKPIRRRLPTERQAITHKFDIAGHEGYVTVGLYDDGMPGEMFLTMAKGGSTVSGFADAFAQSISYALQYGVPLQDLIDKFTHVRFEPSGLTQNPDVRIAKSVVDYVFRWLATKFLTEQGQHAAGVNQKASTDAEPCPVGTADAPTCAVCGGIMFRAGTCYTCKECGATSGCA